MAMHNSARRALDIALATEARAMCAHLMDAEARRRLAQLESAAALVELLRRREAWDTAMARLPAGETDDLAFARALDRRVYDDFARLYRPANDESKEFLSFMTLEVELRAILAALRRLITPTEAAFVDPLPPLVELLPGYDLDSLAQAKSFAELRELAAGGVFGEALRTLELDPRTGLPAFADAALLLENRFYRALADYLQGGYEGPAKRELAESVGFRADMLNITYLLRLRRFHTPPEKARAWLLPLHGSLGPETEARILTAGDDGEAVAAIRASRGGRWVRHLHGVPPERLVREAERAYYHSVVRGAPNLAVVDAFLHLKEEEAETLKRVFVALKYGVSPAEYI